jgi:hypothetical protein
MRIKILVIIFAVSIIIMSSCALAIKSESPLGLSKDKNENAPGHWKKNNEFESQKIFINEIHNRILLGFEQRDIIPQGLKQSIEESIPPVAIITWKNPVYFNTLVFFYADSSYDPDGGDLTLIEWDINGDGIFESVVNNVNPISYLYKITGTFYIRLRVTDDEGQTDTILETITVLD